MIKIDNKLIPKGKFFVAVSGGVDSIAAAFLLNKLNPGRVSVFHFNHNLRLQNYLMEKSVKRFAEEHYMPFVCIKREDGEDTSEAAMHKARQNAYISLRSDIVVCHHLDDAVESYLMNTAMGHPERTPIQPITTLHPHLDLLIRPFLKTRKRDFELFASRNRLYEYIEEDETNKDSTYCRRNYFRNEIVPTFLGMGLPKVVLKKFYTS